ncbi:hypothetical protein GCM10017557_62810 [Streptomyces aurantiacus]|uniref:Uncharacterized protein n=1 Tax=Streptomyces aurantiacus TaxID=47760 RepID=A0A7G1P8N6_9ACTN|nr:hypothetical protein GCM10017557_62810 [Streptomyces aurantiacus]
MRLAADEEIDRDEGCQAHDRQDPKGHGNIHCAPPAVRNGKGQRRRCRRSLPPDVSGARDAPGVIRADAPGSCQIRIDGCAAVVREYSPPHPQQYPITKER